MTSGRRVAAGRRRGAAWTASHSPNVRPSMLGPRVRAADASLTEDHHDRRSRWFMSVPRGGLESPGAADCPPVDAGAGEWLGVVCRGDRIGRQGPGVGRLPAVHGYQSSSSFEHRGTGSRRHGARLRRRAFPSDRLRRLGEDAEAIVARIETTASWRLPSRSPQVGPRPTARCSSDARWGLRDPAGAGAVAPALDDLRTYGPRFAVRRPSRRTHR